MKFINYYINDHKSFLNIFIRQSICYWEYIKISYHCIIFKKKLNLFFDCSLSPSTYGDFFYFIIFKRIMDTLNIKVKLIIVKGKYRAGWSRLKKNNREKFLQEISNLYKHLTIKKSIVEIIHFKKIKNYVYNYDTKNNYLVFNKRVSSKRPVYSYLNNLNNCFMNLNSDKVDNILLKKESFNFKIKNEKILKNKNFITIGCRYTKKRKGKLGKSLKNLKELKDFNNNDLIKTIKIIQKYFFNAKIILVSDVYGCKYYKKILYKNKIKNCFVSKDFSNNYIGDGKLIAYSKIYIQFKSGGIGVFALFSKLPFIFAQKNILFNPIVYSKNKFAKWHSNNQIFMTDVISDSVFFNNLNKFLGKYSSNKINNNV